MILAEELHSHIDNKAALVRALEAVVDTHSLHALVDVWASESQRMREA